MSLADQLAADVGEPEPKSRPKAGKRKRQAGEFDVFEAANGVDTIKVLDLLSISHHDSNRGEMAECPGCKEDGALVCSDGGLKCLHDRCNRAGPTGSPGFRTNVDLAMLVQRLDALEAARWICERVGIDVPKQKPNGASNGTPPPDDYEYTDDDAPDAPPGVGDDEPGAIPPEALWRVHSVDEIFAPLPPINWLVQGLDLCPGAVNMVAGYGFTGKTVALQDMAVCTVAGLPIWGTFKGRQGPVLHVDYEQGTRLTFERYQRIARAHGVGPQDLAGLRVVSMPELYMDGAQVFGQLVREAEGCAMVIVDSLRAATPTIEENDSKIRLVLDQLTRVSEKTGAVATLIHHARKPQQNAAGGAKMAIRGSGALFDACASVLVFEAGKGEPVRVSHEKARTSGKLADDFLLRIVDTEVDGSARGGLMVVAEAAAKAGERSGNQRVDEMKERVRAHFRKHGDQPGRKPLRERLSVNRDLLYAALDELESSGEITNMGTTQRPLLRFTEASNA